MYIFLSPEYQVKTHWLSLKLAQQFKLKDLKETLIENLVKNITVNNFVDFYNFKNDYKNDQLESSCASFLKESGEEIAKSDNLSKLTRVSTPCLQTDLLNILETSRIFGFIQTLLPILLFIRCTDFTHYIWEKKVIYIVEY